jgi:hypothetical protein
MKSYKPSGMQPIARNAEAAFVTTGFKNWKNAIGRFKGDDSSHAHTAPVPQQLNEPDVSQLSSYYRKQQEKPPNSLLAAAKCISFLACQGLPLGGHEQG